MSNQHLLHNVYLFKDMTPAELQMIEGIAKLTSYNPGDEVFNKNDEAHAVYVIKFGSVRIQNKGASGNDIEVAILGTGSHFGEMAFVDDAKRSATVTVIERAELVELEFDKLKKLLNEQPAVAVKFYKSLSHFLCGRLRITTNDLSFARELNLRHF